MSHSSSVLDSMRVPGTGIFFLGCFESRVTVLSQQRRALNLVDAIIAEGKTVRSHGRVAVVGGGAAGLTAAAAFAVAAPALRVDLFERQGTLMYLQRSSDRDLHPHIYDWPMTGSTQENAGLPLLDWRAGPARSVAAQITGSFNQVESQFGDRLKVYKERFVASVDPIDRNTGCMLRVENSPADGGVYDAVILAVGFGYEWPGPDKQHTSYWMPAQLVGPFSPNAVVLVSGNGDGGLVDFSLAALKHLDHTAAIEMITNQNGMEEIARQLREIEEQAWKAGPDGDFDIFQRYQDIDLPGQLLLDVVENLKSDTEVWLHAREANLFRCTTAILNRFTAFVILQADAKYGRNKMRFRKGVACIWGPGDGTAQIGPEKITPTVRAFRFGPAKEANLLPFKDLGKRFETSHPKQPVVFRPATPELTAGARARFSAATASRPASEHRAAEPVTAAPSRPGDQPVLARQWLLEHNVALTPDSLDLYIRSGVAEAVRQLLSAGLPADTLLQGISPLELALQQLDPPRQPGTQQSGRTNFTVQPGVARLAEPDQERVEIVRVVVAAGPRGVAQAAHDALANLAAERLVALARAGVSLELRDENGQSLAARAMRYDDDAPGGSVSGWTDLLVREGAILPRTLAPWILLWAASTNRAALVGRLLDDGVPVDGSLHNAEPQEQLRESEVGLWSPGGTSLHRLLARAERPYAMMYPEPDLYSSDLLQLLVQRGASPAAIDGVGRTPLHIAAREGLEQAARQLMEAPGVDLSRLDAEGESPLDSALHWPRASRIAQMIVHRGLPTDTAARARALHRAANNRDIDVLHALLEAGCDPNATFRDVPGALIKLAQTLDFIGPADRQSLVPCLDLLLSRGADPSLRGWRGRTALHWLAHGKEVAAVERLLEAGVDPDMPDNGGHTPLMGVSSAAIAQRLLAAGAQPTRPDAHGYDALDWAILYNKTDVIPLLRTVGRQPRPEAEMIRAILDLKTHRAAELLKSGVSANTVDPHGTPLLNLAAGLTSFELTELLLDRGAAIDGRDADGRTALNDCLVSFDPGDPERCLTLLLDRGADVRSVDAPGVDGEAAVFRGLVWWRIPAVATRLLDACSNERSRDGETALMAAVERGSAEQVQRLLGMGLDPSAVDRRRRTALHYAAVGGFDSDQTVRKAALLIGAGAKLDDTDNAGATPLMVAVAFGTHAVVDFLIERGANETLVNANGETLQRIALRSRNVSLINRFCRGAS